MHIQGTHCTGKTGKIAKRIPCQGNYREFGNFAKTQGIWFSPVVNSPILKVKDISIFAMKISKFLLKLDKSIGTGKTCGRTGKKTGKTQGT